MLLEVKAINIYITEDFYCEGFIGCLYHQSSRALIVVILQQYSKGKEYFIAAPLNTTEHRHLLALSLLVMEIQIIMQHATSVAWSGFDGDLKHQDSVAGTSYLFSVAANSKHIVSLTMKLLLCWSVSLTPGQRTSYNKSPVSMVYFFSLEHTMCIITFLFLAYYSNCCLLPEGVAQNGCLFKMY